MLFLAGINPGVTKKGLVVFDVPVGLSREPLKLRFRGGFTGDSTIIPLAVQMTTISQPQQSPQTTYAAEPSNETPTAASPSAPATTPVTATQPTESQGQQQEPAPSPTQSSPQ